MAADVEAEVVAQFFHRISNGAWKALAAADNSQARADLQAQLKALELAMDDQVALHRQRVITTAQLTASQAEAQKEAQGLRHQLALLAVPSVTGGDLQHIQGRWDQLTLQAQRVHLEALVERVNLDPGPRRTAWDPARVQVVWKH
jgi:hypothetical protein